MKNIKCFLTTLVLAFAITGTALAGETQTPPCVPGETQTPPCTSAPTSGDSTAPGERQTPPQGVDIVSIVEIALDSMLLF